MFLDQALRQDPFKVKTLSISSSIKREFPYEIFKFINLEELSISCPNLEELPKTFGSFKKLKRLSIHNYRNAISDFCFRLDALETLHLSHIPKLTSIGLIKSIFSLPNFRELSILHCHYLKDFEIPKEAKNLPLEALILKHLNRFESLAENIDSLANLKKLDLENPSRLQKLPIKISSLKRLEYLRLVSCPRIQELGFSFKELSNLEILYLSDISIQSLENDLEFAQKLKSIVLRKTKLQQIPQTITKLKKLRSFILNESPLNNLENLKGELPELTIFNLSNNKIQGISETFPNCPKLKELHLEGNQIQDFPDIVAQIPQVHTILLSNNNLKSLPASLSQLKHLSLLTWIRNEKNHLLDPLFQLKTLNAEHYYFMYKLEHTIVKFIMALHKNKWSTEQQQTHINIYKLYYNHDWKALKAVPYIDQIAALQLPYAPLQNKLVELLYETSNQKFSLEQQKIQKTSEIVLLGKTELKIRDTQQKLKDLGIGYSQKVSNKTTHIVLGKNPPASKLKTWTRDDIVLITAQQIQVYLNENSEDYYLLEEENKEDQVANVERLLLSSADDNVQLAFELLKSGGVPKEMMTLFLYIYMFNENKKYRAKAKKMMQLHGSERLQEALKTKFRKVTGYVRPLDQGIDPFIEGTEIDRKKLLKLIWRNPATLVSFYLDTFIKEVMESCDSKEEQIQLCLEYMRERVQRYRSSSLEMPAAVLRYLPLEHIHKINFPTSHIELFYLHDVNHPLPSFEQLGQLPKVEHLRIAFSYDHKINPKKYNPIDLGSLHELTSLKKLELSSHIPLKISEKIQHLKNLEELEIYNFVALPQEIGQLQSLKRLTLGIHSLKSTKSLVHLKNLKQLTELTIKTAKWDDFPLALTKLTQLEVLNLSACARIENLPTEINQLKNLKELHFNNKGSFLNLNTAFFQLKNLERVTLPRETLSNLRIYGWTEEFRSKLPNCKVNPRMY